ncbi:MAG: radical SAM protein [bacterium]
MNNQLKKWRIQAQKAGGQLGHMVLLEWQVPRLYDGLVHIANRAFGRTIRIDACTKCQLRCQKCSTAKGINRDGIVGWGCLSYADYKRLLDDNPDIRSVELSNWGEIFLNPEIVEILRLSHERKVRLKAGNGVNLNLLTEEMAEALVKYRFQHLSISLDGASQQTYHEYRRRGKFDKVIRNIERINEYKKAFGSRFPILSWQFVIFGHNEHELPVARRLATELGMRFRPKLNHSPHYSPVIDTEYVRRESGLEVASRDEFAQRTHRPYSFPCTQLWDSPQINWDGKLLGCCVNKYGDFGNVFQRGLTAELQGWRYRYAKQMLTGARPPREDIPCHQCKVFGKIQQASAQRKNGQ